MTAPRMIETTEPTMVVMPDTPKFLAITVEMIPTSPIIASTAPSTLTVTVTNAAG